MEDSLISLVGAYKGVCLRYWVKRTPGDWTPYEMERKFIDESRYVNTECQFGYLVSAVNLGYDTYIGFGDKPKAADCNYINFYLLSEVHIEYVKGDDEDDVW